MIGWKHALWAGGIILVLVAGIAPWARAHKGKLPEDALTLVQQSAALLAQNPGMGGEVKERLRAALQSKRPQGVDLKSVSAALQALDRKDTVGARRLLLAAITPTGMPKPPQGIPRSSASAGPSAAPPVPAAAAPSAPLSMETAMKMAEPLRTRFSGTSGEYGVLIAAVALVTLGLVSLRGKTEGARP